MKRLAACLLIAAMQAATPAASAADCDITDDMEPARLYGVWQLSLWPEGGTPEQASSRGTVLFGRHPEYAGSVRGRLQRSGPGGELDAIVSGDVADGEFNLDESANGTDLDAVWTGTPAACGAELRGTRRPAEGRPGDEPALHFLLIKKPGWQ